MALAVSKDPLNYTTWERRGPLFPQLGWSKSGAIIFRDEENLPPVLLWGDTNITYAVADSVDSMNFTNIKTIIGTRNDHFDSILVESGPPPLKLSDGNYLFIYNSAKQHDNPKPGFNMQYNAGWAILNGTDPGQVL